MDGGGLIEEAAHGDVETYHVWGTTPFAGDSHASVLTGNTYRARDSRFGVCCGCCPLINLNLSFTPYIQQANDGSFLMKLKSVSIVLLALSTLSAFAAKPTTPRPPRPIVAHDHTPRPHGNPPVPHK